jgi:hypothetical protein
MRRWLVRVAAICLPMLLGGCLAFGDVDRRATQFDQGVGSFQNRAILLNLARASLGEPMYFVSVGSANAVGLEDFRASLPSFEEGPKLTPALHAYTFSPGGSTFLDNQTSTNTQLNVFSTHDFYLGLMQPLRLEEIDLLLRQGYPRELLFYLTIAKAKITPLDENFKPKDKDPPYYIYNDPDGNPTNYLEFAGHIKLAMEAGLTTDVAVEDKDKDKSDDAGAGQQTVGVVPPPTGGAKGGGVEFVLRPDTKSGPKVIECLDRALQSKVGRDFVAMLRSKNESVRLCGEPQAATLKNVVYWPKPGGGYEAQQVEIVFRSTYEIFRYLGALSDKATAPPSTPDACEVQPLNAAPTICDYTTPDAPKPIGPILWVVTDKLPTDCFTSVAYSNRHYCVPKGGPELGMTKDVFNILVSLLALKQSPGDLPTPQAVLLQ